jgi:integrase
MPLKLKRYSARGPNWYLRGTVQGQAVYETTGTNDRKAAEAIRIQREADLFKRSIFGPGASVTFLEAAVSYLANGGEARFLGAEEPGSGQWSLLIGRFQDTLLPDIGQEAADAAAQALYPGTAASTRIRQCYVPLIAVLTHAAKMDWCAPPMIEKPAPAPVVTKFSSVERLERLLPHCAPKLRLFVMMDTYTGGRLAEILRVDWDKDISLARRTIMLWQTKTKQRAVYIPDPLLIELAAVPEADRHGPMFHWAQKTSVHRPLKNACKRAGVEYLPPHQQGRHTYATWMTDYGGLGPKALMEAGGWESVQSVMRYLHVTPGQAAKQADKLPAVQNPCSEEIKPLKDRKTRRKIA